MFERIRRGDDEERKKKILDKQCNPMYFQGVRTIMKSDSTGPQRFGQPWPDGPDVGGLHRFTNTAVPRFDGTGCWQQHLLGVSGYYEIERVVTRYGSPTVVCAPGWRGSAGGPITAGQNQRTLEGLRGRTVDIL